MSTYEFLSFAQEFRSIIWFFVFLVVLVIAVFSVGAFVKYVDKKERSLLAPDSRFNDYWD